MTAAGFLHRHVGRRGGALALLAAVDVGYGIALYTTRPVTMRYTPTWWPASLGVLAGIPVHIWGIVWVCVGLFMATGVPRRWRGQHGGRWQFAADVALKSWWALASVLHWWKYGAPGAWAPAVTYAGFAALVLLIAGWREPPEQEGG